MKNFLNLLEIDFKIFVGDIGAAAIAEEPIYKDLVNLGYAHLYAFDGDKRQQANIKKQYNKNTTIIDKFILNGKDCTVYICNEESGMTSLLKPSKKYLEFFNGFSEFGKVIETKTISTHSLDSVKEIERLDFLKMDIQGSELEVLKNGKKVINDIVAMQLETPFVTLYEKQPTFGDIDTWMRKNGFLPHTFTDIKKWSIHPLTKDDNIRKPFNQLLEADIIYIKDPTNFRNLSARQLKLLALFAIIFKSPDLLVNCVLNYEKIYKFKESEKKIEKILKELNTILHKF